MSTREQVLYILTYDNSRYDTAYIMSRVDASVKMNEVYKYLLPTIASECRYMDKHITEVLTNDVLDRLYHKFDIISWLPRCIRLL